MLNLSYCIFIYNYFAVFSRSADYNENNKYCYLNYETKDTKPNNYKTANGYTHLHRTCEEEEGKE